MVCVERRQSTASDERTRRSLHGRAHLLSARVRGHRVRGHQSGQRSSGQRSLVRSEVISGSEVIGSEVISRVRGHQSGQRSSGQRSAFGSEVIHQFRVDEGLVDAVAKPLPSNAFQRAVWTLLENPESSLAARIIAILPENPNRDDAASKMDGTEKKTRTPERGLALGANRLTKM